MQEALEACEGGVLLDVDVKPSAQEDRFPDGYNEWRQRVGARVQAPAEGGQANRALCELVARRLDADPARVGIRSGQTSSRKTLFVGGCSFEEVRRALAGVGQA